MKRLLLLLVLVLSACQTSAAAEKEDKPPIPWEELQEPPAPAEGSVVPLPADAATEEEKAAMLLLGIPFDGYVLSPSKLKAAAELRVYAEQTYADAKANTNLGKVWTDSMWRQLERSDAALDEALKRENSWWNRNKGTVLFGGGFVIGAASAILMAYGLDQALGE